MSKQFKVTGLSESGLEIKDLIVEKGLLYDFPHEVKVVVHMGFDNDGLPIVVKSDKPDTYSNCISLGHFIYEEIEPLTTPFDIIKNELLGKHVVVYKKVIQYEGELTFSYYLSNDFIHRYEIETIREVKQIKAVHYIDGDYDRWPTIDIELDNDIIIHIDFDTPIEYA